MWVDFPTDVFQINENQIHSGDLLPLFYIVSFRGRDLRKGGKACFLTHTSETQDHLLNH